LGVVPCNQPIPESGLYHQFPAPLQHVDEKPPGLSVPLFPAGSFIHSLSRSLVRRNGFSHELSLMHEYMQYAERQVKTIRMITARRYNINLP
jgi:hypothetical protein